MQIGDGNAVDVSADGRTMTFQAPAGHEGALTLPGLGAQRFGRQSPGSSKVPDLVEAARAIPTLLEGPLGAAGIAVAVIVVIVAKRLHKGGERLRGFAEGGVRLRKTVGGEIAWAPQAEPNTRASFEARYGRSCK